jgi:hypothetical protein
MFEQGRPTKEGDRRRNIHGMSPACKLCQGILSIPLSKEEWLPSFVLKQIQLTQNPHPSANSAD